MSSASSPSLDFKILQATTPEQLEDCMSVRFKVFVDEQGYDGDIEKDELDPESVHFLLYEISTGINIPAGNVRLVERKNKLGRLAVLPAYRKYKLGAKLVNQVRDYTVEAAKKKGEKEAVVMCHAQAYVVGFYEKLGYVQEGPRFQEEETEHQKMILTVPL
ncbi:acyl-CoA N-acyltransferase [Mrakia frigida]|uniref:GNAT family N-acetyltransferase n=1 Tax=Mrakia frigida TaxID=29902 RepID=UPI003FCC0060